jgi:urease accessory protein
VSDLLKLTQWLSPAFPLGSYAYSHGLEWAISARDVYDPDSLSEWLSDILDHGSGRADATLLAAAHRGEDAGALADVAAALAPSKERWDETLAQGTAFSLALGSLTGAPGPAYPFPVAVGVAARALTLPTSDVTALYLHSFTSNLVSAAVRFVPLGQNAGQKVLGGLHPLITRIANDSATAWVADIANSAVCGDMASMRHEHQDVRLFKT